VERPRGELQSGLHSRVAAAYQVHRESRVLPCRSGDDKVVTLYATKHIKKGEVSFGWRSGEAILRNIEFSGHIDAQHLQGNCQQPVL
jgi:hypothetical protein